MASKGRRSVLIAKVICGQCKMEIKEEKEENIQCDKCAKLFHSLCTKLDKRQYEHLLDNESEEYVCHLCDESNGSVKEELKEIKTKLNKLDQLSAVTEAIEFMSKQYDEILKGVAENRKKVELVQKENRILKNEIAILKTSVKILNDQRVKNDCIVSGVEVKKDVTAIETVLELSGKIGIDIKEDNIEDAYFFKKRGGKNDTQTMVVKFSSRNAKDKLMKSKPKLKEMESMKTVYVNDYLSKEALSLFNYAKTLKTIGYGSVYTTGGRVYAKKSQISKPRYIKSEEDVDAIISEAATLRPKRRSMNRVDAAPDDSDGDENQSAFLSPV